MGFLRKPKPPGDGEMVLVEMVDPGFTHPYPALAEFLSAEAWDDGSPRETATMFLFTQRGRWKCMLKCRASQRISFWTASTLEELFMVMESALQDDTVDWKADRKPAGRGR
jgi:hypothetical protein